MWRACLCLGALVIGEVLVHTTPGTHWQTRRYTAAQNGKVVRLHDAASATGIAILPSAGNLAVEMKVKGHNVLRFPYASAEDYPGRGDRPAFRSLHRGRIGSTSRRSTPTAGDTRST